MRAEIPYKNTCNEINQKDRVPNKKTGLKPYFNLNKSYGIVLLSALFILTALISTTDSLFAQHHGAPPPMATLGDRNISMDLLIKPMNIIPGKDAQLTMHLTDENAGQKIQHVTYRLTIAKDDQVKLSEFFHSHTGDLNIVARNSNSSHLTVGGTFDVLTNAIVPDPAAKIVINGPLFTEVGKYNIDAEVTTIDNDKTDLPTPLVYHFTTNSSTM